MAIHFEHGIDVSQSADQVFAVLDDVSQTPKWLARCTGIEKLTAGENAIGTKLRYSYKEPGHSGKMDGEITARIPNESLTFHYWDKMMDVIVDFVVSATASGTHLVHAITITPKTFFAKLMSGMIRKQLPKQTITAMESLRELLNSGGS
jgi:hypothetical protein